jgi:hypothetical protein
MPSEINEISEEHFASIFMVEEKAKLCYYLLHSGFLLQLFFFPEYGGKVRNLHNHCCENLQL